MRRLDAFVGPLLCANLAGAASIGVFADPDFTSCNLDISVPPFTGTLYIAGIDVADIPGLCEGFTGAEFRVAGLPAGWVTFSTPNPAANAAAGDPFAAGAAIDFVPTQLSNNVLLYTVTIWPATLGAPATLSVTPHTTPADPRYSCIVAAGGDCPGPVRGCIGGGTATVNMDETCVVGVVSERWGPIKSLLR